MAYNPEGIFTTLILTYYILASIVFIFRQPRQPVEDPEIKPKEKSPNLWTFLRKVQLGISALVLCLLILRAVLRGVTIDIAGSNVDSRLVCNLFFLLMWLVLFLGIFDFTSGPSYPHHGAWILSIASLTVDLDNYVSDQQVRDGPYWIASVLLQASSITCILGLLVCSCLASNKDIPSRPESITDETRPLLSSDNNSPNSEDEPKQEMSAEEKDREALQKRPFLEYVKSFRIFIPFMVPSTTEQRLYFGVVCLCTAVSRVVNILRPLSLGAVIDGLIPYGGVPWRRFALWMFLQLLDSSTGISLIQEIFNFRLTSKQTLALNAAAYDHVMDLSADFHENKRSPDIWQSMWLARSVSGFFRDILFSLAPSIVDLLAAVSFLHILFGPYMSFIGAITGVLFVWATAKALGSEAELQRKHQDALTEEMDQLVNSSFNWKTVVEFGQLQHEKQQFREKGLSSQKAQDAINFFSYASREIRYLLFDIGFLAAASLAAIRIERGEANVGDFVVLTSYWGQLTGPLSSIVSEVQDMTEKFIDAERLLVLLERKPTVQNKVDAITYKFLGGAVDYENVSFSYDGQRIVSDDINFSVMPGSTVALVGETGGGKSTILKLLFRFYDTDQGRILIDGQDIKDLEMESFRKHLAIVPQNPDLFSASVIDNVRYANLSASDEEVYDACKHVSLHDKIMTFTKGYQELVGEQGVRLSGGELQRLAIARAILKRPDILLLDEATSSVDSITESQIQDSLDKLCKGKTTFVIAHRLSTILKADQILVIKGSKLVESGKHAELIEKKGAYYDLWSSQLKLQSETQKASDQMTSNDELTLINDLRHSEELAQELAKITTNKAADPRDSEEQN